MERIKLYDISLTFNLIYFKVSTIFTEANNTLPYQETQTFKDMLCEFRKKMVEASQRSVISLSQRADECQDLEQLFPPKSEGTTTMSKFDGAINKFKVNVYNHKRYMREI